MEDGSHSEDAERHEVERIMRAAEDLGHDPQRVARALDHSPLAPLPLQRTVEVRRRPVIGRFFARRSRAAQSAGDPSAGLGSK